jgi:hypothetical protein
MNPNTTFRFVIITLMLAGSLSTALNAHAQTETVLYSFKGKADGALPSGDLIFDADENIYGTATTGGQPCGFSEVGCGVVYRLAPGAAGWVQTVLYAFTGGADGAGPGGLISDSVGNLYGVAAAGGNPGCLQDFGCGLVFQLSPTSSGWQETVLYAFTGGDDGSGPIWRLVMDGNGNLYGTTFEGGNLISCPSQSLGCGAAFKLSPGQNGWTFTLLYSFTDSDSSLPTSPLILDKAGNLYGTGAGGGYGVVYELSPTSTGSWKDTLLYTFDGAAQGYGPTGLLFDDVGSLYGTTYSGGTGGGIDACGQLRPGCGTVFKLSRRSSGWTEQVLHNFNGKDYGPSGTLIFDNVGNLYGVDSGDAYKLSRGTNGAWKQTVLHTFLNPGYSADPYGPLLMDKAGNLFGVTYGGGIHGWGSVFEITP